MRTSRHAVSLELILFLSELLILISTVVILFQKLRIKNNRDSLFLCTSAVTEESRGHDLKITLHLNNVLPTNMRQSRLTNTSIIGSAKLHVRSHVAFAIKWRVAKLGHAYFAK